ncbi:MAG: MFS transporter [Deltaproteobacteria bacterium]|nr:MFS transporter [Deltaproteobacteria bacterium]
MDPAHADAAPPASNASWLGLERKWWVMASVGLGTFMSALNGSIVNAIVPVLMRELKMDLGTTEWVTMVFLVLVSGLLLGFGRLGDLVGHKRVNLTGFAVFATGLLACGLSWSAPALIAARGVQAVGAAMLMATGPALITRAFPGRQRGQALGMQGTFTYLGLMVGPALGGVLTERFGWPSVFYVGVPFTLLAMLFTWRAVADGPAAQRRERFDFAGAACFLAGLAALLLALSHGEAWGWSSVRTVGFLASAVVLLGGFVAIERSAASPMLDLSLFAARGIRAAVGSALLNYVCVYAVMFLVPFYLLRLRAFSPSEAGLLLSAQALVMAIAAPLSGTLSDRIGSRLPSSLGMGILALGLVGLSTLDEAAPKWAIAVRLAVLGLGTGIFVSPNNSAVMGAAPRNQQGVTAAVLACARNVGMVLGVAIAGAVFARTIAARGGSLETLVGFVPAFRVTFLVTAGVAVLGGLTSLARGPRQAAH